ncbi:MAG: agmatine deiminase family protein [bacterium]|nr:agmatine deiminase family protein [bacterium]
MIQYDALSSLLTLNKNLNRRQLLAGLGLVLGAGSLAKCSASSKITKTDYNETGVTIISNSLPLEDGYYMPAEWAPHEKTIMAMPTSQNWKGYNFAEVRKNWAAVANALAGFEPVSLVVSPADIKQVRPLLDSSISIIELPVNDGWTRDTGPLVLSNGKGGRRITGFTFNGWGEKLSPYRDDALLKARLAAGMNMPLYPSSAVIEGGAFTLDGEGTIITTEENLLHRYRNPGLSKKDLEKILCNFLGGKKVIWLNKGVVPDELTDGHVDGICVFTAPGQVILHMTDDSNDPNYAICRDALRRLESARDARGNKLDVIQLPLDEEVLHINFYIGNGCVIVPCTGIQSRDREPLGIIKDAFPGRKVISVPGKLIGEGGGGVHCITQQVPK